MSFLSYLIHLPVLISLAWWIGKKQEGHLRMFYFLGLSLKCAAGILVGCLYFFYYKGGGDTIHFFQQGQTLAEMARTNPLHYFRYLLDLEWVSTELIYADPRSLFFVKIVSLFSLATADSYWLISLYFSFIAFQGTWLLICTANRYLPSSLSSFAYSFLFLPSLVFWSSGLIKDSIACAAIHIMTAYVIRFYYHARLTYSEVMLALIAVYVGWYLKYYHVAIFLSVAFTLLMTVFIVRRFHISNRVIPIGIWFVLFFIAVASATLAHPNFNVNRIFEVIKENHDAFILLSAPGDFIDFGTLEPSFYSLFSKAPLAVFSALFRPFFWETTNALQFLLSIENAVLLLLTIWALARIRHTISADHLLVLSALAYVLVLAVFLAFSAPNFGSLSRYRVAFLPYFVCLLLCATPLPGWLLRYFNLFRKA